MADEYESEFERDQSEGQSEELDMDPMKTDKKEEDI